MKDKNKNKMKSNQNEIKFNQIKLNQIKLNRIYFLRAAEEYNNSNMAMLVAQQYNNIKTQQTRPVGAGFKNNKSLYIFNFSD